eukprot:TRINITY_DN1892_c0_g1_i2.p1 TRINITY_DN1892_c0_g1~~TRINITY_DN1892_c0_g1_i2.p1  ORF type:complete len:307 (+),score=35.93 TRINITY_DN1892_c0_g1_i2:2413-3333(+)
MPRTARHLWHQAGRALGWKHFGATLTEFCPRRSVADPCFYTFEAKRGIVYLIFWADDVLLFCASLDGIKMAKACIANAYDVRDMRKPKDFLGMRVELSRSDRRLTLSNPGHTAALLEAQQLIHANPTKAPMMPGVPWEQTGTDLMTDKSPYLELVGSLLYLSTTTRPDISLAVGTLARYMHEPEEQHWRTTKTVMRYLAGTADFGLLYSGGAILAGYTDAGFAGDVESRRSTSGWLFMINGAPISWQSRRQPMVSTSTTEAEYLAAAAAAKEALWLRKLLADLGEPLRPVRIAEDNTACLSLINNP